MMKRLLLVLLPVVLMATGAFAVWGDQQEAMPSGCNKCAKAAQAQPLPCPNCPKAAAAEPGAAAPCPNCPKAAARKGAAPCANCPKAAAGDKEVTCPLNAAGAKSPCGKCPKGVAPGHDCEKCGKMKGAKVAPAGGCAKCAGMQQDQPVEKECCKKKTL